MYDPTPQKIADAVYWIGPGDPDVYYQIIDGVSIIDPHDYKYKENSSLYKILQYNPPSPGWFGGINKASLSWVPKKFKEIKTYKGYNNSMISKLLPPRSNSVKNPLSSTLVSGGYRKKTLRRSIKHRRRTVSRKYR